MSDRRAKRGAAVWGIVSTAGYFTIGVLGFLAFCVCVYLVLEAQHWIWELLGLTDGDS